jgi:predicted ester cyclase
MRAAFAESALRVEDIFVAGDRVVARYAFEATHVGSFLGVASTGRRVAASGILIARFDDCRIAELWREEDAHGMLVQMGALPAAA